MSTSARRVRWVVIALLLFGTPMLAVPKPEGPAKPETAAERLRRALEQTITVEYQAMTLTAAIEALQDQTKLNIVLDRATAMNMGISPEDGPVSLKLTNVKLKTVLRTLLSQFSLTYVIDQDILLLTTEPVANDRQVRQRVSIDLDRIPLETALRQLSRETGTNLVIDPRHAGKSKEPITLKLDEVPLDVAVRLVAEMAGLRSVRQSNVLFITSKDVAAELRREDDSNPMPQLPIMPGAFGPGGIGAGPVVGQPPPAFFQNPPVAPPPPPAPAKPAENK